MPADHGRPYGRKPKPRYPNHPAVKAALERKKAARRTLASMTPEQRALWRV